MYYGIGKVSTLRLVLKFRGGIYEESSSRRDMTKRLKLRIANGLTLDVDWAHETVEKLQTKAIELSRFKVDQGTGTILPQDSVHGDDAADDDGEEEEEDDDAAGRGRAEKVWCAWKVWKVWLVFRLSRKQKSLVSLESLASRIGLQTF